MSRAIAAIVMVGPAGSTPIEGLLDRAIRACVLDLLEILRGLEIFLTVVAGPDLSWLRQRQQAARFVVCDEDREPFHFGSRLATLIEYYGLQTVLYFGAGSTPLMGAEQIGWLVHTLEQAVAGQGATPPRIAVANNLHSCDWLGFSDASAALSVIRTAERDNGLAWRLQEEARYDVRTLPGLNAAAGMDLDTPTDLAIVRQHPRCGNHLLAALGDPLLDRVPVKAFIDTAVRSGSRLALIGRVAPVAWQALSQATQAWIRVFSEERGMVASARLDRAEVKSLLLTLLKLLGPEGFFRELAGVADAAILDSRVLMAASGNHVSAAERFASDLLLPDQIANPWLREFTAAAAAAPIPVLLGGHGAVAGGLHALTEIIAQRRTQWHSQQAASS